ncbi:hypothetical protein EYF80_059757 [Liparis tanakae]|uniref:Uncharacterized protein n=1 Tax=Liparis tanakae TaxID=230148 RepID=A0A4Z2EML8_9TELE|nr:hypothetical protein EYF80_059757 [Liparis tanakae]
MKSLQLWQKVGLVRVTLRRQWPGAEPWYRGRRPPGDCCARFFPARGLAVRQSAASWSDMSTTTRARISIEPPGGEASPTGHRGAAAPATGRRPRRRPSRLSSSQPRAHKIKVGNRVTTLWNGTIVSDPLEGHRHRLDPAARRRARCGRRVHPQLPGVSRAGCSRSSTRSDDVQLERERACARASPG